eukprot:TRINITY_DN12670_c0_g1_i1.p1 TRINITY_DN12670_c0_g1~~TRINITY_DN12670_c0_g1_i1.p1  ORF type:complete len:440 (+),score=113.58 TRINITY_DN12670_c0_g1_i1:110-1429(+)
MATTDVPVVAVAGAGLAGLSFVIALAKSNPALWRDRITVYESGADDDSRRGRYAHSLSVRTDVGGVDALDKLGLLDAVRGTATPSTGFFLARNDATLVISTTWFGGLNDQNSQLRGIRTLRYALWKTLYDQARSLGVDIRFGCEVQKVSSVSTEFVEFSVFSQDEGQLLHLKADLLVVADGSRSRVRDSVARTVGRHFLETTVINVRVAGVVDKIPESVRHQHGLLVGTGFSMFIADEGDDLQLLSLAFTSKEELTDEVLKKAEFREFIRLGLSQFHPDVSTPIRDAIDRGDNNVVLFNCYDRFPEPPVSGRVVFIGDASHAVSPFSGSGANMALVDGVILAQELNSALSKEQGEASAGAALERFFKMTEQRWTKIVKQQRSFIRALHSTSWVSRVCRYLMFRIIPVIARTNFKQVGVGVVGVVGITVAAKLFLNQRRR